MAGQRYPRRGWEWPNGAKLAISINLALEAFERQSQYATRPPSKHPDPFSLSYAEYGARSGAWRLMDLLDEFGLKGSCSTNGYAAQLYPEVVRAFADGGHEIVGHGWANDELATEDDPAAEQAMIARCTAELTKAAGVAPVGWTSPGSAGSSKTMEYLRGAGYLWNGDVGNDDLPWVKETPLGPIVMMPRTNLPHNDLPMWLRHSNPGSVIAENWQDTVDELYAEGVAGSPKWTEITIHCHIGGRPTLVPTIRKCLQYARRDGVWFGLKREIAAWALDRTQRGAGG
jgi:peptidoglycan/xylan/chitin deacetylase (PgdA/CDA1 family)